MNNTLNNMKSMSVFNICMKFQDFESDSSVMVVGEREKMSSKAVAILSS